MLRLRLLPNRSMTTYWLLILLLLSLTALSTRAQQQQQQQQQQQPLFFAGDGPTTSSSSGSSSTTTGISQTFAMPPDFYATKCDPCVARSELSILVFVDGTTADVHWQQTARAMEQAGRDTGLKVELQRYSPTLGRNERHAQMASDIRRIAVGTRQSNTRPDALIVSLPTSQVGQAVRMALESGMPVFGFQTGYEQSHKVGLLGFVGQDEALAGTLVAQELLRRMEQQVFGDLELELELEVELDSSNGTTTSTTTSSTGTAMPQIEEEELQQQQIKPKRVLFVNHDAQDDVQKARFQGLQETLQSDDAPVPVQVTTIVFLDRTDVLGAAQTLERQAFNENTDCYDFVVLGDTDYVDVALSALDQQTECTTMTQLVVFGTLEPEIMVPALVQTKLAFVAAPQPYIASVFAVVMTAMFVTTGKTLALPRTSKIMDRNPNQIYLSGPHLITSDNIPTDSQRTCQEQAFPVCRSSSSSSSSSKDAQSAATGGGGGGMNAFDFDFGTTSNMDSSTQQQEMVSTFIHNNNNNNNALCNNNMGCLSRTSIRIGGVLHGVSSDLFWDPVFAAATQAALDVGINLELERLEPQENAEIVFAKMAARIQSLCESGVDGLFITIPDVSILDAIRLCQSLNVPVLSINAGAQLSKELGLLQHIGQDDYSAGFGAGQRLIQQGIQEAYCINHAWGNVALDERCRGLEDAIAEHAEQGGEVVYNGMIRVEDDKLAKYQLAVETAVRKSSPNAADDWDKIGLLTCGASQINAAMQVKALHMGAIFGSFDLSENMFEPFADGRLVFGIDQQPLLQGSLPVYLLTYAAYTQQALVNDLVETGPRFVDAEPSDDQKTCEANFFAVCSIIPDQDFQLISNALLITGYIFMAGNIFCALVCILFVAYYRNRSQLVRMSQPPFLFMLCCGCIVSSLSVIPMSTQTQYRYITGTVEENPDIALVDAACMMGPWLYSIGFAMVFSSLYAKVYRVKLIFTAGVSFRRQVVTFMDVAPHIGIIFSCTLALLIAWQVAAPFEWERDIIDTDSDGFAIESIGKCTSEDGWWYWLGLLGFQCCCLLYALALCFQTRRIQDDISESSVLFLSCIIFFQILLLGMPISIMVLDDTDVYYFVRAGAVLMQNSSVLALVFAPKMYRIYRKKDNLPVIRSSSRRSSIGRNSNVQPSHVSWAPDGSSPLEYNRNVDSTVDTPFSDPPGSGLQHSQGSSISATEAKEDVLAETEVETEDSALSAAGHPSSSLHREAQLALEQIDDEVIEDTVASSSPAATDSATIICELPPPSSYLTTVAIDDPTGPTEIDATDKDALEQPDHDEALPHSNGATTIRAMESALPIEQATIEQPISFCKMENGHDEGEDEALPTTVTEDTVTEMEPTIETTTPIEER